MKTSKIFLIIALMFFTTMSFSSTDPTNGSSTGNANHQFTVKISLQEALLNSQLSMVMHQQINPALLKKDPDKLYVADVSFKHILYHIYGTHQQWLSFFSVDLGGVPANE